MIKGYLYRLVMRIAHRFNWHYAPPIYPENDVQLWCQWCGFRQTIKRGGPMISGGPSTDKRVNICDNQGLMDATWVSKDGD